MLILALKLLLYRLAIITNIQKMTFNILAKITDLLDKSRKWLDINVRFA